jgi:type I restriction enzyme S subunit
MAIKPTRDLLALPEGCSVTFQELIEAGVLEIGDGYRAKNEEMGHGGPIFLRAGHVSDTHISFEGVEYFKPELAESLSPKMARAGDTIVTTKGNSTGRIAYATADMPPFVYSPHLSYWRSRDHAVLPPGLLRYWASSTEFIAQLGGMKASTDMAPYLSLTDQRRLRITLPPPNQRRAIAGVLGALDDKIEVNRKTARVLEGIARAVFTSWFVDFDPVRTRAATLASEGVLEIGDGYRAKNSELAEDGLPFVRAGDLQTGFTLDGVERLGAASVAKAGNKLSRPGDVAFTSKGTVGRISRVDELTPRFVYSPQVCFWRTLNPAALHPAVLYCWMCSEDFIRQVLALSGQTDMAPYISLRDQRAMVVPRFANGQVVIGDRIAPLLKRQAVAVAASRTLAALRDALLPKLISGELRIADAEKIVGSAE